MRRSFITIIPSFWKSGAAKENIRSNWEKLYPEQNFIGLDIKGARMWKGAKTAVENGMNNVAFLRMYAEMLESAFRSGRNCRTLDYLP